MLEKQYEREVGGIKYLLIRKSVKNINFHVYTDGRVMVTANNKISVKTIDDIVLKHKDYIEKIRKKSDERKQH